MNFINPIYQTQKVRKYLIELISDYDYSAYADLTYSDKCYFAGLLMEAAGKNGALECLTESDDLDQTLFVLQKSLTDARINETSLGSILKHNTVRYYDNLMKNLFEDCYGDYFWATESNNSDQFKQSYEQFRENA